MLFTFLRESSPIFPFKFVGPVAALKISKMSTLLARCLPSDLKNAVKLTVKIMEFDTNLNMHFSKHETVYAHDPSNCCKPGDVVLIDKLPQRLSKNVTHQVNKVVYPFGDITDPITNKKVVAGKYRWSSSLKPRCFSCLNTYGFDYQTSLERGWQKEKRDFSYKETYRKYHMFDHEDPYAV
nr:EOG090X0GMQ [Scapholeberis mucronata]